MCFLKNRPSLHLFFLARPTVPWSKNPLSKNLSGGLECYHSEIIVTEAYTEVKQNSGYIQSYNLHNGKHFKMQGIMSDHRKYRLGHLKIQVPKTKTLIFVIGYHFISRRICIVSKKFIFCCLKKWWTNMLSNSVFSL